MGAHPRSGALLLLVDDVLLLDADLGDDHGQQWLAAAVEAVAQTLLDVAAGADAPRTATLLEDQPPGTPAPERASCAAAAHDARVLAAATRRVVAGPDGAPSGLGGEAVAALDQVAVALGSYVDGLAEQADPPRLRARLHRELAAAHRRLQPATLR